MGYKDSTQVIDHTCPVVDDLTQTCLSLIDDDFREFGLEGGYDNEVWKIVENRVKTLVGKIKEEATEKMRDALDTLVSGIDSLEAERDEFEAKAERFESESENNLNNAEYWEDQYNSARE